MSFDASRHFSPVNRYYSIIDDFTRTRYWTLKLSIYLTGFVLLTTYPNYLDILRHPYPRITHSYFFEKTESPLTPLSTVDNSRHEAKIAFRLTVPLLAKTLNIGFSKSGKDIILIFVLQSLLLVPFLYMLTGLFNRFMNPINSLLLTIACSSTYMAKAFFWDFYCWFDGYAYLFLLGGMYFRKPWAVYTSLLLASWTDERAVVALGGVYLFHRLVENDFEIRSFAQLLPDYRKISLSAMALLVLLSYLLGRWWLASVYGLSTPSGKEAGVSLSLLPYQLKHRLIGILFAFEGLWILILMAIFELLRHQSKLTANLIILGMVVHIIIAYCVYDITRSLTYAFPLVLMAAILFNRYNVYNRRQLIAIASLTCVLIPTHYLVYYIFQIPWSLFAIEEFNLLMRSF